MRVLFVHRAFPAQFGRLAAELTRRYGWRCHFLVELSGSYSGSALILLKFLSIAPRMRPMRTPRGPEAGSPFWLLRKRSGVERALHKAVRWSLAIAHNDLHRRLCNRDSAERWCELR